MPSQCKSKRLRYIDVCKIAGYNLIASASVNGMKLFIVWRHIAVAISQIGSMLISSLERIAIGRALVCGIRVVLVGSGVLGGSVIANPPEWWLWYGITLPNIAAADYSPLNQGQLKQFALGTLLQWQDSIEYRNIPGGVGQGVTDLLDQWTIVNATGQRIARISPQTDDYAIVNVGQLKAVAKVFYDRMIELGAASGYPWSVDGTEWNGFLADDYAIANIGQAKTLFSFDLMDSDPNTNDFNFNGRPDWWERIQQRAQDPWGNSDAVGPRMTIPASVLTSIVDAIARRKGWTPEQVWLSDLDGDGVNFRAETEKGTDPFTNNAPNVVTPKGGGPLIQLFSPPGARMKS